jgi:hypothetical protein
MVGKHLISEPARPRVCHRCGALTLIAVCEGLTAVVDTTPITDRATEELAWALDRWTYILTAGHMLLLHVSNYAKGHVLVAHRCGQPFTFATTPLPASISADDTEPPFG